MMWLLICIAVIALAIVLFLQDTKHRNFSVLLPIALFSIGITFNLYLDKGFLNDVLLNLLFVSALSVLLMTYMRFRFKSMAIIKDMIGLGDIIILFSLTGLFEFKEFKIVLLSGIISSLIFGLIYAWRDRKKTIPYAGIQALVASVFFVVLNLSIYE